MRAFLIARVSTEDQKDALPAQIYRIEDYAKKLRFDYETIQFQESAYKGDRAIFSGIITKIQASKELVAVVFDKVDRFTRDTSGEEVRRLKALAQAGFIEMHFVSDHLIINKDSSANDILQLDLGSVLAQYYSGAISDNVKRRFEQMWRDGIYTGKAPFGYINIGNAKEKRSIETDPIKAEAVKKIFEWYASGNYSIRVIRTKLKEEYGVQLATSRLANVIKNPFYMGEMLLKGNRYPHCYEKLVSEELYEQAQDVRTGRLVQPKRWAGLPFKYRGLIECEECGSRITFEKQKQKYIYGHCTQFKGKHGAPFIREDQFDEQLSKVFDSIKLPEDVYEKISKEMRLSREADRATIAARANALDLEIAKFSNKIDRLYEDHNDGKINDDLYERKYQDYTSTKLALEKKRKNIELSDDTHYGSILHLLKLAKNAPELFKKADNVRLRSLANETLSNLRVSGDQLRWELKKPYDIMAFCNEKREWQPYRTSRNNSTILKAISGLLG